MILWLDSKAQKKSILTSGSIPHLRLGVSCEERIYHLLTPKGGAKSVRRAKKSGNGRRLAPKTLRGRARARVFDGASAARSSSRFFAMRSLLCAARNDDYLFASAHGRPPACGIALQKQPNSHFGKHPAPPIGCLLQGADLPPFVTERWCQKCPPGEKLRETHSASLKRAPVAGLQANRPRFLTLVAARFCFRTFRNAERLCASRNHDFDSFYSVLASRRPAGSHCEDGENRRPYFTAERIFRKKTHVRPGVPAALLRIISIKSRKSDGKNR